MLAIDDLGKEKINLFSSLSISLLSIYFLYILFSLSSLFTRLVFSFPLFDNEIHGVL